VTRSLRILAFSLLIALVATCRRAKAPSGQSAPPAHEQQRVDTVNWAVVQAVQVAPEGCCNSMRAFRIAVTGRGRADTLPVLALEPGQLGDGALFLRVVSTHADITFARYDASTGVLDSIPPPPDYEPSAYPAFYGPTRLLAYGVDTAEESRAVVRRWPDWQLVAAGHVVQHCNEVPLGVEWNSTGRYLRFAFCRDDMPAHDSLTISGH